MYLSAKILGSHVAHELAARAGAPVLTIGSDTFRRSHLAAVGCFNFIAAQHLTVACASLGVQSTADLFARVPPHALALPGIGVIALAVLGAAFEAKRLGGRRPLEAWAASHRAADDPHDVITFHTMKAHEAKREKAHAAATRRRRGHAPRTSDPTLIAHASALHH